MPIIHIYKYLDYLVALLIKYNIFILFCIGNIFIKIHMLNTFLEFLDINLIEFSNYYCTNNYLLTLFMNTYL